MSRIISTSVLGSTQPVHHHRRGAVGLHVAGRWNPLLQHRRRIGALPGERAIFGSADTEFNVVAATGGLTLWF
jgi:hypothetical protein